MPGITPLTSMSSTSALAGSTPLPQSISKKASSIALSEATPLSSTGVSISDVDQLEDEVIVWTPACLAQWFVWGIVQARDDVLAGGVGEFDYLNYARGRVTAFRAQLKKLGVQV